MLSQKVLALRSSFLFVLSLVIVNFTIAQDPKKPDTAEATGGHSSNATVARRAPNQEASAPAVPVRPASSQEDPDFKFATWPLSDPPEYHNTFKTQVSDKPTIAICSDSRYSLPSKFTEMMRSIKTDIEQRYSGKFNFMITDFSNRGSRPFIYKFNCNPIPSIVLLNFNKDGELVRLDGFDPVTASRDTLFPRETVATNIIDMIKKHLPDSTN